MAGLLDYIQKGGNALATIMERLGTPNIGRDPAMDEMMSPGQRAAAERQAKIAGLAGMQEAASKNQPWYAMGTARDFRAQPAYNSYVDGAVASVEELRKRRDADGRRQKVAELVGRISNPEDPLSQEYTPEQIAVLGSLTSDEQAALLSKAAFPKENGINVATAGTVQGARFKLGNGNIGAMIQTGNPADPVHIVDTGQPYVSEDPSDIRSLMTLLGRPDLVATAGNLKKAESTGTATGTANVTAATSLTDVYQTTANHVASLQSLRDQLASLPSGALTGRVLQHFSSEFQSAQAALYQEALLNIGELKQQGVSLQPISVDELMILLSTSPKLTNNAEANLQIIDGRIKRATQIMEQIRSKLDLVQSGGDITQWRPPGIPTQSPSASPVPGYGDMRPGDVANPPRRAVSTIPTIRKPGQ